MIKISRKARLAILLLLLACTVGCDQTAKNLARTKLGQAGSITLPGGWGELRLAENPGSFLGLGDSMPAPVRHGCFTAAVTVGLVILFRYLVSRAGLSWRLFFGLSLVLSGGIGNLIDRLTRGGLVTDFIFLQVGPFHTGVFNVADVLIMAGTITVAWALGEKPPPVFKADPPR
jgi:signal peptidase II